MSEHGAMVAEMVSKLFADLGPVGDHAEGLDRLSDLDLPSLLVPEAAGGFGGDWLDAAAVFRSAGKSAVALPIVEWILARHAAFAAAWQQPPGLGTVAERVEGVARDGAFTGLVRSAVWGRHASYLVVPEPMDGGSLLIDVRDAVIEPGTSLAGEYRDLLHFVDAPCAKSPADVFALGAFARAAQAAGALNAALTLTVDYINTRQQFGRTLAKFQAVQQAMATFAAEVAAVNCAAFGAAAALDRGDAAVEIAAAKLRTNVAIGEATAIAHQAHGAIGITQEYSLQQFTRRLWSWRSEFGGDSHWSAWLGDYTISLGADQYWAKIVDRSDPRLGDRGSDA